MNENRRVNDGVRQMSKQKREDLGDASYIVCRHWSINWRACLRHSFALTELGSALWIGSPQRKKRKLFSRWRFCFIGISYRIQSIGIFDVALSTMTPGCTEE